MSFFRIDSRTLEVLEWPQLREHLAERARTAAGRELCRNLVPGALSPEAAQARARAVTEALELRAESQLQLPLGGEIPSVTPLLLRMSRSGAIVTSELFDLVRFQRAAVGLNHFLLRYASKKESLRQELEGLELLPRWTDMVFPLLDAQGNMVDGASEDLLALRSLTRELHERIKNRLEDYLHNPKTQEILQDAYVTLRDGRYVIPVKSNFRGRVGGIVHDVSNSEATLFIEPQEIVEWNNQLKVAEKEIEREIERILAEVVEKSRPFLEDLGRNQEIVARADLVSAASMLVGAWQGSVCVAEWGRRLHYEKLRHPLLALNREVVPSSLEWEQAFVLSGPNTGGKTVLLKGVGLGVLLAWSGLPVPAIQAVVPADLQGLQADIGDDQSLEENLSTFSGHLLVLKEMLFESQPGDLILIDEIATGTSPEEGQPLAQAVIEDLLRKGMRLMVTTHYGGLKQFALADSRCRIASMAFDGQNRRPTYQLLMDVPGESSAFEIAEQLGLPGEVVERARNLRGEVPRDLRAAVERLESARHHLQEQEKALAEARLEAEAREAKAQEKILEYERRQRQGLSDEAREVLRKFSSLRDELAQSVKQIGGEATKASANDLFVKLGEASDQVRGVMEASAKNELATSIADEEIVEGALVEVEGFGLGTVVETPRDLNRGAKSPVQVLIGDLQMTTHRGRLKKPTPEQVRAHKARKASVQAARERKSRSNLEVVGRGAAVSGGSGSVVCDVRGRTVEDAMRRVENCLNELARDAHAIITIIHGHGSERLKDNIREYLRKERPELEYRPGTWPGEGGDGVTLVERAK